MTTASAMVDRPARPRRRWRWTIGLVVLALIVLYFVWFPTFVDKKLRADLSRLLDTYPVPAGYEVVSRLVDGRDCGWTAFSSCSRASANLNLAVQRQAGAAEPCDTLQSSLREWSKAGFVLEARRPDQPCDFQGNIRGRGVVAFVSEDSSGRGQPPLLAIRIGK